MTWLLGAGRYVVGSSLGMGGMGVVYEAEDLACTRRVAIKILHREHLVDGLVAEHMVREAHAGRAIHHRNVVAVFDAGRYDDRPFVVMELAHGRTLGVAAAEGPMSVRRAVGIVDQILAGVGAIHDAGFIHGDLKSDNVLVAPGDGGTDLVKIIDLGLARERAAAVPPDEEHVISGTPDYLAPELALGGKKTIASDLYAVATILYELLTGSTPFGGAPMAEVLRRQVEDNAVPPSLRAPELGLSLAFERVMLRALEKRPDARYPDAAAFRAALRAALKVTRSDGPIQARTHSTSATTENLGPAAATTRPKLAVGTQPPAFRELNVVVDGALDAARARVAEHRLSAARRELEAALAIVEGDPSGDVNAWRLQLALAAVCAGLHDARHARDLARLALDGATRAHSETGKRRAKALIRRFGQAR